MDSGKLRLLRRSRSDDRSLPAELHALLFEETPVPLLVARPSAESRPLGNVLHANRAALNLIGSGLEEISGKQFSDLFSPGKLSDRECNEADPAVEEFSFEAALIRAGTQNTIPVECSARLVTRPDGELTVIMVRDISKQKAETIRRTELEQQLRHVQKMQAVGQLASGVAHDFNNLITAITGNSELLSRRLRKEGEPPQWLTHGLQQIERAGQRAAALTKQLLTFSRKGGSRFEVIDLNELLAELTRMLGRVLGGDVEVRFAPGADLLRVRADATELDRAFLNLAINARDAMPGGGTLIIETENVTLDEEYAATHPHACAGPNIVVRVRDTGVGMDAQTLERIFEPFFTTKPAGKGSGLGLPVVYGIVHEAGGHVTVTSKLLEGTTFNIFLPGVNEDAARPAPAREHKPLLTGSGTILLCEDEQLVRSYLGELLSSAGYSVLVAENGERALALMNDHRGEIDLLMTDLVMPGMSGSDLAELTRLRFSDARVLYLSAYTPQWVLESSDAGTAYVQKPFSSSKLLEAVNKLLRSEGGAHERT